MTSVTPARLWNDEIVEKVRNQPLEPLARQLGYRNDPRDPYRWKRTGSVINIHEARFYDFITESGGAGAIDLVMHAHNCSFPDAVSFLTGGLPGPQIPPHCENNWPAVRNYLITFREIEARWVDACRRRGLLGADARGNAVFICTDENRNITGAEIIGTGTAKYRGMARGSRKSRGSFWLPVDKSPPHTIMLTESAIDALSAYCLEEARQPGTVILSTTGVTSHVPSWVHIWTPQRILIAFDADLPGDEAASRFICSNIRATRMRPPEEGMDWNDTLRKRASLSRKRASPDTTRR